jgi:hypothetical protein
MEAVAESFERAVVRYLATVQTPHTEFAIGQMKSKPLKLYYIDGLKLGLIMSEGRRES